MTPDPDELVRRVRELEAETATLAAAVVRLRSERRALRAALVPFAKLARHLQARIHDSTELTVALDVCYTVQDDEPPAGDCRRARELLAAIPDDAAGHARQGGDAVGVKRLTEKGFMATVVALARLHRWKVFHVYEGVSDDAV